MARQRFGRRRSSWVAIALTLSLLVLILGRDVAQSAHADSTAQASENLTFATLAATTVAQEAQIDVTLHDVLTNASHETRAHVYGQLLAINVAARAAAAQVAPLTGPALFDNIGPTFVRDAQRRARAYEELAGSIATSLQMPWSGPVGVATALNDLSATQVSWASAIAQLVLRPGHAVVSGFPVDDITALTNDLTTISSDPNLALVRSATIRAVSILPAPLPATGGVINLVPVTSFQVSVSAENTAIDSQPVTLTATLTFADGHQEVQTARATIGPTAAVALQNVVFSITPGTHATLQLRLDGAPALASGFSELTYHLFVAAV